jgi:hypothetical protein
MSKQQAELSGSILQQWNMLAEEDTSISIDLLRDRNQKVSTIYGIQDSLCVCLDISGLMQELGFEHKAEERVIFYAVLLHTCGPSRWDEGNLRERIPHTECNQIQ